MISQLVSDLHKYANQMKAKSLSRFFKTKKGEYGEGEVFLGVTVPQQRKIAKQYLKISFSDIQKLLSSKIHEERFTGLIILAEQYKKAIDVKNNESKKKIFDFYLKNTKNINNWDLVDLSAPKIFGNYLLDKSSKEKEVLYTLIRSKNIWGRRIAVLSTFAFIRQNQFKYSLKIAKLLLHDEHDLIHKAVGWMLREIGKRNLIIEEKFLQKYCGIMQRTMLRYAIEKFDKQKRENYLKKYSK